MLSASVMFQYFVKIVPTMYVKVTDKVSEIGCVGLICLKVDKSTYKFKRAFFATRPSDRAQICHACVDRDETGSHQKIDQPHPRGV